MWRPGVVSLFLVIGLLVGASPAASAVHSPAEGGSQTADGAQATISGTVLEPDGSPAAGDVVQVWQAGYFGGIEAQVQTSTDGEFAMEVPADGNYDVTFVDTEGQRLYPENGVPDLALLEQNVTTSGSVDLSTMELGQPRSIDVTVTYADTGEPVTGENVEVSAGIRNSPDCIVLCYEYGGTSDEFTDDGRIVFGNDPGIELAGTVGVEATYLPGDEYNDTSVTLEPGETSGEIRLEVNDSQGDTSTPDPTPTPTTTPSPTPTPSPSPTPTPTPTPTQTPSPTPSPTEAPSTSTGPRTATPTPGATPTVAPSGTPTETPFASPTTTGGSGPGLGPVSALLACALAALVARRRG